MESLRSVFFKIDRSTKDSRQAEYLTSTLDIHYSIFDIRFFIVSFSIRPAVLLAGGGAEHGHLATFSFLQQVVRKNLIRA
jgi:hypothetical protein